jgi:mRNA interferase RelE/StbE
MAGYKVYFREPVEKDLRLIPKKDLKKILQRIEPLAAEPRPPGSEKLTVQEKYRLRYGRYRILYSIQDKEGTVWIVKAGHRRDVYRGRK